MIRQSDPKFVSKKMLVASKLKADPLQTHRCHDGYKGEDCNSMIQKVIDLRSLLVIITILLLLFIMSVIVFTYIYVKKLV